MIQRGKVAMIQRRKQEEGQREHNVNGSTTHLTSNSGACKFNKKNLRLTAIKGVEEKEGEKEGTDSEIIAACDI